MIHAKIRCDERLTVLEKNKAIKTAKYFADSHPQGEHAVLISELDHYRGMPMSDDSNGDTIVAIIREGDVATIMLRRTDQPFTKEALRVSKCWRVK